MVLSMKMPRPGARLVKGALAAAILAAWLPAYTRADSQPEEYNASVLLDGKQIGKITYSAHYGDEGDVEELRTKASISALGIKLYKYKQTLHEVWKDGRLQRLAGDTDDNGTRYDTKVNRAQGSLAGAVNGESLTLPAEAFPQSPWHYAITQQTLLFGNEDLKLKRVQVERREEPIELHGTTHKAERVDFTGDWEATIWYGPHHRILKAQYALKDRQIEIVLEPYD